MYDKPRCRGFGSVTYYSCMLNRAGATGRGSNAIYVEEMASACRFGSWSCVVRPISHVCDGGL